MRNPENVLTDIFGELQFERDISYEVDSIPRNSIRLEHVPSHMSDSWQYYHVSFYVPNNGLRNQFQFQMGVYIDENTYSLVSPDYVGFTSEFVEQFLEMFERYMRN